MTTENEIWRKNLRKIACESLEGMDEDFRGIAETIQRLLKESRYGRKSVVVEYGAERISATEVMRDALRDMSLGNKYSHSEGIDKRMEVANQLLSTGETYLGRFGRVSVEPFPEGYQGSSVRISFEVRSEED